MEVGGEVESAGHSEVLTCTAEGEYDQSGQKDVFCIVDSDFCLYATFPTIENGRFSTIDGSTRIESEMRLICLPGYLPELHGSQSAGTCSPDPEDGRVGAWIAKSDGSA
eukprot:715341_1